MHTVLIMSSLQHEETKERKVRSIVSQADYAELERHHRFLPPESSATWQDRMVQRYHQHLYKDYVLADFRRAEQQQLGLRWRTETEVRQGRGSKTCGNKHCPSLDTTPTTPDDDMRATYMYHNTKLPKSEEKEVEKLKRIKHGTLLSDFEVPFTYTEDGMQKTELVKLRLCARCAPLLFATRGEEYPALAACQARRGIQNSDLEQDKGIRRQDSGADDEEEDYHHENNGSSSRKKHKHKKEKKRRGDSRVSGDSKRRPAEDLEG